VKVPGRFKAESAGPQGQTPFSFENFVAKKRKLSPNFQRRGSSPQHSYAFQPTLRWLANRMGLTLTVHPLFFFFLKKKNIFPRLFRVWVFSKKLKFHAFFVGPPAGLSALDPTFGSFT